MRDLDAVFDALAKSAFRRRFALGVREGKYLREKGIDTVVAQASNLIAAIELKSLTRGRGGKREGISKNFMNRAEEALGSAADLAAAYREGLFRPSPQPWVGYLALLARTS